MLDFTKSVFRSDNRWPAAKRDLRQIWTAPKRKAAYARVFKLIMAAAKT